MRSLKHFIIILALALTAGGLAAPAVVSASSTFTNDACAGVKALGGGAGCTKKSSKGIGNIVNWVVNILSVIVGIAAVIMIIVGGLKFITSSGEASNTAAARNTILYALIGLAIVVVAQVLVHFVLNKTSNAVGFRPEQSQSLSVTANTNRKA